MARRKSGNPWVGLAIVAIALPGFVAGVAWVMKQNDAYVLSLAQIRQDPALIEDLGSPLDAGFFVLGKVKVGASGGTANIEYAVKGPKAEGRARVSATKKGDEPWQLRSVIVRTPAREVDVLADRST